MARTSYTVGMPDPIAAFHVSPEHAALMFPAADARADRRAWPRMARGGRSRAGEVLFEPGDQPIPFFVVLSGAIQIVRARDAARCLIVVHGPGSFTGEANMLLGRPSLMRARADVDGEAVELTREQMLALVQNDTEIGDIVMRGFLYRRLELIAQGMGDVVLLGSVHCASTLRIREFLDRNSHPFTYVDLDREPDVEAILDHFHVKSADIPVLICRGDSDPAQPVE